MKCTSSELSHSTNGHQLILWTLSWMTLAGLIAGNLLLLGPALIAATYPIVSVIFQPQAALPSSIYSWLLIGMLMKAPRLQRGPDADQLLHSSVYPGQ